MFSISKDSTVTISDLRKYHNEAKETTYPDFLYILGLIIEFQINNPDIRLPKIQIPGPDSDCLELCAAWDDHFDKCCVSIMYELDDKDDVYVYIHHESSSYTEFIYKTLLSTSFVVNSGFGCIRKGDIPVSSYITVPTWNLVEFLETVLRPNLT